jgi:hypothetical protein
VDIVGATVVAIVSKHEELENELDGMTKDWRHHEDSIVPVVYSTITILLQFPHARQQPTVTPNGRDYHIVNAKIFTANLGGELRRF